MKILVKSGIEQLPLFEKENFPYFEAYLRGDEERNDLNKLLQTKMKLEGVHLPATSMYQGKKVPLDFCGQHQDWAFSILKGIIEFCEAHGVQYIIVHLGFFNSLQDDRWKILRQAAELFAEIKTTNVKVCMENVPCWTNICLENEPAISSPEHFLFFRKFYPAVGCVLDVDHLAINTVFRHFYADYREEYKEKYKEKDKEKERKNYGDAAEYEKTEGKAFRKMMEREINLATTANPEFFRKKIEEEMMVFLSILTPDLIHAVGSDFCNYRLVESLPLVGEALPLGFKGMIKGFPVEDRLDHAVWLSRIPKETWITIELMLRSEYNYIDQIRKSTEHISTAGR